MIHTNLFASVEKALVDDDSYDVAVIASAYGLVDRHADVIIAGAFADVVAAFDAGNPIPVLFGHDTADPVGTIVSLVETDTALIARVKFANTARGQEVRQLVKDGAVPFSSVGIQFFHDDTEMVDGVRVIKRIAALLELSMVPVPANPGARVLMAKSLAGAPAAAPQTAANAEETKADPLVAIEQALADTGVHDTVKAAIIGHAAALLAGDTDAEQGDLASALGSDKAAPMVDDADTWRTQVAGQVDELLSAFGA